MNLIPIESSNIHSAGYDPETRVMCVRFRDYVHKGNGVVKPGAVYEHLDVSPEAFEAFMAAESKGAHFAAHIRRFERTGESRGFEHRKVEE
jgi:hypothetical protein